VREPLTTICCSAGALIALFAIAICAQSTKADSGSSPLFPVRTLWTLALKNPLVAAPAYDDRTAYFSISEDRIVAYDLDSGARKWLVTARPETDPIAARGLLFVTEPAAITALRADTGQVAWQLPVPEKLAVRPVWDNGWLVTATAGGSVLAFRGKDGSLTWRRDIGSPAHAAPALKGDRVYVPTEDGRVVALQVATGAPVWERRVGGAANEILVLEDRLYVGSKDNYLNCLMVKDGVVDWRWRTGGDVIGVPIADERRVYFVALDNMLRALHRTSGGQQWMRPLPLRPTAGPARAAGTILVAGVTPTLRGYSLKDGSPAGEFMAAGEIAAAPHVVPDPSGLLPRVLVITRDVATGAAATLIEHDIEPAITPIAPLPNLVTVTSPTAAAPRN
jgi:outer membrane protein assembly factor BamB